MAVAHPQHSGLWGTATLPRLAGSKCRAGSSPARSLCAPAQRCLTLHLTAPHCPAPCAAWRWGSGVDGSCSFAVDSWMAEESQWEKGMGFNMGACTGGARLRSNYVAG